MTLCSNKHEEVCFDGLNCPACELLEEIKALNEETSNLKDEIKDLTDEH